MAVWSLVGSRAMTHGKGWNEAKLSEDPAVEVLQRIGFTYVAPEVLEAERERLRRRG